jgi:rhamnosyltransferase
MTDALRVTAVISSYNPPTDLVDKIGRLRRQVDSVIVVDDGSRPEAEVVLDAVRDVGAEVIALGSNQGIAAALNAGLQRGRYDGADLFLTLDQDSEIDPGYVDRAVSTYSRAIAQDVPVGIICAASHNHLPVMLQAKGSSDPEAFDPMQSGTLIPESTLSRIGLFEEPLFIDCVDSEYTARLRRAGLKALIAEGCNITHAVGDARPMRLGSWHVSVGGRKRFVHSHAPFRVYYIARNGLVLYKRYLRDQPRWVLRRIGLESVFYAIRVLYGPHRGRQVTAIGLGVVDAVRGRTGRLTARQEALVRPR